MMTERETFLQRLLVGDIFHAAAPNGASLVCLITRVTETTIEARTVTHQMQFQFDRRTGAADTDWGDGEIVVCIIDSVAPLPVEIHDVMLGLDRKMRLEHNIERIKLNDAEKRALIFVGGYYSSNPL